MKYKDGTFYAEGRTIKRRPSQDGSSFSFGFSVCEINPDLIEAEKAAETFAAALNFYFDNRPEEASEHAQ